MKVSTLIRAAALILVLACIPREAEAALIALYDPAGSYADDFSTTPNTQYVLIEALNDVQVTGLAVNYDPGPGNANGGFDWRVYNSDANGDFSSPFLGVGGYNPPLGSPDPRFGTYETPVSLTLNAGQYYVLGFQANNDPNSIRYERPGPLVTSDGNFQVLGGGDPFILTSGPFPVAEFSLHTSTVPEPAGLLLFGSGAAGLLGLRRRVVA
jgi:hypothetical protein